MKHSVHITFITGSMTHIEVEAGSAEEAREKVFSRFAPGTVSSVAAWAVNGPRLFVRPNVIPVMCDSAFGALV